jgi:hypothetical protein
MATKFTDAALSLAYIMSTQTRTFKRHAAFVDIVGSLRGTIYALPNNINRAVTEEE